MKKFLKLIKFKLTLWYSLVLLIIAMVFVLSMNVAITAYFQRDPMSGMAYTLLDHGRTAKGVSPSFRGGSGVCS